MDLLNRAMMHCILIPLLNSIYRFIEFNGLIFLHIKNRATALHLLLELWWIYLTEPWCIASWFAFKAFDLSILWNSLDLTFFYTLKTEQLLFIQFWKLLGFAFKTFDLSILWNLMAYIFIHYKLDNLLPLIFNIFNIFLEAFNRILA